MSETVPPPAPSFEDPKEAKARAKADKAYAKASRPWYQKKRFIIPGLLVLLLIVGSALGGGDEPGTAAAEPATAASSPEPDSAPAVDEEQADAPAEDVAADEAAPAEADQAEAGATIGTPVRDGSFEFTVNEVECGIASVGNDTFGEDAQGQFCRVNVTVENIGNEPQYMFEDNQLLFDGQGREFSANSSASLYANEDSDAMWLAELNPGLSLDGDMYFDIPSDEAPASIELHDSAFSGGVTVTLG